MKYRYEFDLGPSGVELTRMLRGRDPDQRVDDSPDETCWQNAARNVHAMSNQATPNQATDGDAPEKARLLSDSGNEFIDQCETANEPVTDQTALTSVACWECFPGLPMAFKPSKQLLLRKDWFASQKRPTTDRACVSSSST